MFGIGMGELLVILGIVLLLFGTKRLKTLGADLGSAIKGFRSAVKEEESAPAPRERVIDHGDLVVQDLGIAPREADAFLDDGPVVGVERSAIGVVDVRAVDAARLGFERVVAAIAVRVDPPADRITERCAGKLARPGAAVGEDAAHLAQPLEDDVGGLRQDDEEELRAPAAVVERLSTSGRISAAINSIQDYALVVVYSIFVRG